MKNDADRAIAPMG
jgi:hypothetical protein